MGDPYVFFMNLSPHFGQVICSFPLPFGTRSVLPQLGQLKYL